MTTRSDQDRRSRRGPRVALLAAGVLTLGAVAPGVATGAPVLPSGCERGDGRTVTCTYTADATFTVPAGVTALELLARGGPGGRGGDIPGFTSGGAGGAGAATTATVPATPGATLTVRAGARGADGTGGTGSGLAGSGGSGGLGFGVGGRGADGRQSTASSGGGGAGGGGGGSAVLDDDTALIVAAGGAGGGGAGNRAAVGAAADGGRGGDADAPGAPGGLLAGTPGQPGTQRGPAGGDGASGGAGFLSGGGGGGGGGLRGGSGGEAVAAGTGGGPGGGGGSSLGSSAGTNTGSGQVVIRYTAPLAAGTVTALSGSGQSAQAGAAFAAPLVARVDDGLDPTTPVPGAPVTFTVTSSSATFDGAPSAEVTSGADGRASAPTLTAGSTPGPVTVTATAPGATTNATYTLGVTAAPAPAGTRVAGSVQFRAGNQTVNLLLDARGSASGASGRCAVSGGGVAAACTAVTGVTRGTGANATTATVTGTARGADGRSVAFRATVVDLANPNGAGRDRVSLTVGNRTLNGTVVNGNLTVG